MPYTYTVWHRGDILLEFSLASEIGLGYIDTFRAFFFFSFLTMRKYTWLYIGFRA